MSLQHYKVDGAADFTGTVTVVNNAGVTTTLAATDLVRPSDWNSVHRNLVTLGGNTSGASSLDAQNIVFLGGNNVTLNGSQGTGTDSTNAYINIIGPSPGAGAAADRMYKELMPLNRATTVVGLSATNVTNRPLMMPFWMEGTGLNVKTARFLLSGVASSNRSLVGTFMAAIYSQVNSTQISLIGSDSFGMSITDSSASSAWNGAMWVDFTNMSNVTLTNQGHYVMAFMVRPTSANATYMSMLLYGGDTLPTVSRVVSNGVSAATNASYQFSPYFGVYSATTAGFPATMAQSQIYGGNQASQVQYYAVLKEI